MILLDLSIEACRYINGSAWNTQMLYYISGDRNWTKKTQCEQGYLLVQRNYSNLFEDIH